MDDLKADCRWSSSPTTCNRPEAGRRQDGLRDAPTTLSVNQGAPDGSRCRIQLRRDPLHQPQGPPGPRRISTRARIKTDVFMNSRAGTIVSSAFLLFVGSGVIAVLGISRKSTQRVERPHDWRVTRTPAQDSGHRRRASPSVEESLSYNLERELRGSRVRLATMASARRRSSSPDLVGPRLDASVEGWTPKSAGSSGWVRGPERSPIIMVTAKAEESDQLVGFATRADDYVTKPYSMKVLVQRIKGASPSTGAPGRARHLVGLREPGVVIDRHRRRRSSAATS